MKEFEIRRLFLDISNIYNFPFDDYKVKLWGALLEGVTYEQAAMNLKRYALDPANQFAPHPGALAETPTQRIVGPYVPNAEETRRMLDEQDKLRIEGPREIPTSAMERMRALGYRRDVTTS